MSFHSHSQKTDFQMNCFPNLSLTTQSFYKASPLIKKLVNGPIHLESAPHPPQFIPRVDSKQGDYSRRTRVHGKCNQTAWSLQRSEWEQKVLRERSFPSFRKILKGYVLIFTIYFLNNNSLNTTNNWKQSSMSFTVHYKKSPFPNTQGLIISSDHSRNTREPCKV